MSLVSIVAIIAIVAALAAIPRRTRRAAILVSSLAILVSLTAVVYASARVEKPALEGSGPLALVAPSGLTAPDHHEPRKTWRVEHFAYVGASEAGEAECLGCHADPDTFCNQCHSYVGVGLIAAPMAASAPAAATGEETAGEPAAEAGEETVGEPAAGAAEDVPGVPTFSGDVQPLLNQKCVACHGAQGGLSVSSRVDLIEGGRHGPAILPGDAEGSLLIQTLRGTWDEGLPMPLSGPPLTEAEIDLIARWIEAGAPDD